jgi:tetratricopeptide (TPR) repeat protein
VKRTCQGEFARAHEVVEQLAKIAELYEHELAASGWQAVRLWMHVERRELREARRAIELYLDEHRESLFNLQAFATRAKVETLIGEHSRAATALERADDLLSAAGRTPPWHASTLRSARYLADVSALERAQEGGDPAEVGRLAKRAAASRRVALATAAKVAWRRPEVLRLAGREAWLMGRREVALDWWRRGIACCQQLGAQPELGRTWQAAGEALSDWRDGPGAFEGRDAAACLDAARRIFVELDLAWDLARLKSPRDV